MKHYLTRPPLNVEIDISVRVPNYVYDEPAYYRLKRKHGRGVPSDGRISLISLGDFVQSYIEGVS